MTIYLPELSPYDTQFPSPGEALTDPNGLLAMGGDLSPERLISAYNCGIFPWYSLSDPILWWSPSPRAIFIPGEFTPSRSLKKFFRRSGYRVSINQVTETVIRLCGSLRTEDETWLDEKMQAAYTELAHRGLCHSVEVWDGDELVGGLYGVQVGLIFCGESMFSLKSNASKIALWAFCEHFHRHGGKLIDCQILNPHTESLGAIEIARSDYLTLLETLRSKNIDTSCYTKQWLTEITPRQEDSL
ncbi:leucyl/phenylalanyl-tRNA--protein transferase [Vibrio sp. HA2012]|uniref:leucyl/phenylalanyl-tRNA--protein transferase n=1 Tax=Vibrio sp. HA2012 TaxID=1971595 RepID=UPI000C2CC9B1|nr:leucyl/phenylalanyl-tRNA--protein transferase [Vibrio sp. HA2012]PJC88084.1 leucyl/phenylalanyl-tRNA--protein transferase [Vibrio sp. HA2012]